MNLMTGFLFENKVAHGAFVEISEGVAEMLGHRVYSADVRGLIGQAMAAVGDTGRDFVLLTMGFQIGLPLSFGGNSPPEEVAEAPITLSAAAPVEPPVEEVRISLDPRKIFFSTNSSRLVPGLRGTPAATMQTSGESAQMSGCQDVRAGFLRHPTADR